MAKHTAFVKRNRVQVSDVSINPFQIRKKLGTLHVTAASGAGGRTFAVNDLDVEEAYAVLKWPLSKQHKQRTKLFESPQESTSSDQTTTGTQQTSGV
jgi:uncharacterized membrane protein YdbT with pleckstrin-like domain